MPFYKTEGIVLKKQEFGETDEIVSLLSPKYGNKKIMVKGVRKVSSSRVGKFELFSFVNVMLAKGRTFDICSQVEVLETHSGIKTNLVRMTYGLYLLELFEGLLFFSEPHPDCFFLLKKALSILEKEDRFELLIVFVLFNFLRMLGYQPVVLHCLQCSTRLEEGHFSPKMGGILCNNCFQYDKSSLRVDKEAYANLGILQCLSIQDTFSGVIREDIALKLRKILEYYVFRRFSKKLYTSRLIGKVNFLNQDKKAILTLPKTSYENGIF